MTDLALTPLRRESLEQARDGRVTFDDTTAQWLVDGEPAAGWAGRTFAELLRANYVSRRGSASAMSTVDITSEGKAALG